MRRLNTPIGLLFTVALLAVYSAYAFQTAAIERSWLLATAGMLAAIASVGTALLRPWSRYLVYALALAFVTKFTTSVRAGAEAGYFGAQFESTGQAALSLLPEVLIGMMLVTSCLIVHRHFASGRQHKGAENL